MIEFIFPVVFLLLPLPWLMERFMPQNTSKSASALIIPDIKDFPVENKTANPLKTSFNLTTVLAQLAWIALVIAAARPVWFDEPVMISKQGRDLMLAVDLSGSMMTADFEMKGKMIDRLTATKEIVADFIDKRKGDRLGLILFGSSAYLQAPLTFDTSTVKQLLKESAVGLAGNETAIGDAIGLSLKHLQNSPGQTKVLILLTDGINNTGELSLEQAADMAARADLKIHTVAIGSSKAKRGFNFMSPQHPIPSAIDEEALQMVADKTHGKAFRAYDAEDLKKIYRHLDKLEPIENQGNFYRPRKEVFFMPLGLALMLISALGIWKVRQ